MFAYIHLNVPPTKITDLVRNVSIKCMCKYTLGIPKKSSNITAKGELGIYHLNNEISVRIIKFFFHLMRII